MHLSYQEHVEIYRGLCGGLSMREIASSIGRHTSTVTREVARNSDHIGYLFPKEAYNRQREKRGRRIKKIERIKVLKEYIIEKLTLKWSPKVIAGRWNKMNSAITITHECIYQWVHSKGNEHLRALLPRAKKKRGLSRKKQQNKSKIPHRKSLDMRPAKINDRSVIGHFEADLVFNKGSMSSNVLTAIDRKSRYAILIKNESKRSMEVIEGLKKKALKLGVKSVTFDNGTEFTLHYTLTEQHMIDTYFCDPGKPWQKGSIENFNGLLRHRIPFEVDPKEINQQLLNSVAHDINHTPRESLGYLTPCEVFKGTFQKGNTTCCIS